MKIVLRLLIILLFSLAFCLDYDSKIKEKKQELEGIYGEISKQKFMINETDRKAKEVADEITAIEKLLKQQNDLLERVVEQQKAIEKEVDWLEKEIGLDKKLFDQVLNELRNTVVKSLQQKGIIGEQKDGMDISFIVFDTITYSLQYSGANSPLYIISENSNELTEIKPDKMPVSIYINMKSFTNHVIKIEHGDTIYLTSDGYSDQFGGKFGKKFYSKQLKHILQLNSKKTLAEQGYMLDKAIEDWRNKHDTIYQQTDDITVLGIKV